MKTKVKLWHVLIILGLIILFGGSGIVIPTASIVSIQTPMATVTASDISAKQAVSVLIGLSLLVLGIIAKTIPRNFWKIALNNKKK